MAQRDELLKLARMAHARGDRAVAMQALQRLEAMEGQPETSAGGSALVEPTQTNAEPEKMGTMKAFGLGLGRGVEQMVDDNRMAVQKGAKINATGGGFGGAGLRVQAATNPKVAAGMRNTEQALDRNIDKLGSEIKQKKEFFDNSELGQRTAGQVGAKMGRALDDVAMAVVPGSAGLKGATMGGFAIGSLGNAQQQDTDIEAGNRNNFSTTEALIEGAMFAGGEALGIGVSKLVGSAIRAVSPSVKVFDDAGKFTPEAIKTLNDTPQETIDMLMKGKAGDVLSADQMKQFNELTDQFGKGGFTKAQVTKDTSDFVDQQQAIKQGGRVDDVIQNQSVESMEKLQGKQGALGVVDTDTGVIMGSSVRSIVDEADEAVDAAYTAVRADLPNLIFKPQKTLDGFAKIDTQNTLSGGAVEAAEGELKRIMGSASTLTPENAETYRQALNAFSHNTQNPQARHIFKQIKSTLDDDVMEAAGKDFFKDARKAKVDIERRLQRATKGRRDKNTTSILHKIVEGKIPDEKLFDRLVTRKGAQEDLDAYFNFLKDPKQTKTQKAASKEALSAIRDQTVEYIVKKGFPKGDKDLVARSGLNSAIERIGRKRLRTILGDSDFKDIIKLNKALQDTTPPNRTAMGTGPSGLAIENAEGVIMRLIESRAPWITGFVKSATKSSREAKRAKNLLEFSGPSETFLNRALNKNAKMADSAERRVSGPLATLGAASVQGL